MRRCIKVTVVVAGLILLVGCGWMDTLEQPVTAFFEKVAAGDVSGAYQLTSTAFRAHTSQQQLMDFLEGSGLSGYASASWHSFSIKNDTGKLSGTVTTRNGGSVPLSVHLVREQETWRIQRIELAEAGVNDTSTDAGDTGETDNRLQLPPEDRWAPMAVEAVALLGDAINRDDYSDFLAGISPLWRSQTGAEQLRSAFQEFKVKGIDLTRVRDVEPVFSGPAVRDENGLMRLAGVFPTEPYQVHFELKFHRDTDGWRLFGISVNAK